jgi:hypothetical protein
MRKSLICIVLLLAGSMHAAFSDVLIVADEFPAMQVIADKLKAQENIAAKVIWQTNLPPSLKQFEAVMVYIHKDLPPEAERAFIDYANDGGKLILLHHSISSGKRKNRDWFKFIGVTLPEADISQGGYKWIEGVTFQLFSLAPSHYIMTNKLRYPEQVPAGGDQSTKPGFTLHDSEVYLNHVLNGPRTVLMGLRYTDPKSGSTYTQNTAGWFKKAGKGWLVYFMPGHRKEDFENSSYGQMVVNSVTWKP